MTGLAEMPSWCWEPSVNCLSIQGRLQHALTYSDWRSCPPRAQIMRLQVLRSTHIRVGMSLMQQLWDVGESSGWLSEWWLDSKVGPNKRFLIQSALGDSSVCVHACQSASRCMYVCVCLTAITVEYKWIFFAESFLADFSRAKLCFFLSSLVNAYW